MDQSKHPNSSKLWIKNFGKSQHVIKVSFKLSNTILNSAQHRRLNHQKPCSNNKLGDRWDQSYKLRVVQFTSNCAVYNETIDKYVGSEICQLGPDTNENFIHCVCPQGSIHTSLFYPPTNNINFSKIMLNINENSTPLYF